MIELNKLKLNYQQSFDKGLKKEVMELLKKIHNIGKNMQKKYKYSIQQQFAFLLINILYYYKIIKKLIIYYLMILYIIIHMIIITK